MCGDCRKLKYSIFFIVIDFLLDEVIKRIAAIRKCKIIVRDANRFHHFTADGKCSCNDYFLFVFC